MNTRLSSFVHGSQTLHYFDIKKAVQHLAPAAFERMPFSARIFAENLLRRCPEPQLWQALEQVVHGRQDTDIPFYPARVVLQDLTGTPALVDIAGMRDAVAESGGDPNLVNPKVPVLFVVDHSLCADVGGYESNAMKLNMENEARRNAERFEFLSWCKKAMTNLDLVMPGNGILHQINIERLSPVVDVTNGGTERIAFPDSVVGTDSHTPMINALGVVGWGVGGIEAESVMLGRAISMRMPQIVGVRLTGKPRPGLLATDIVLTITENLRAVGVVECIVEFHGPGTASLSLADRGTISNMAPEYGATAAMFAIDDKTLEYLRLTGRSREQCELVEAYARAQGLWADGLANASYDRLVTIDLGDVEQSMAGPANPHQRVPVAALKSLGIARETPAPARNGALPDFPVVIAAITSCTNTSNPRTMIAAGLLAQKAIERGLTRRAWVKTSLAPGSRAVESYLGDAGLLEPLSKLGFGVIGFGCTSCNGMSGPLQDDISDEIQRRGLTAAAVLSGNRNFEGRIHPYVKQAFIASPPLVVAYAIAGTMQIDVSTAAIGKDAHGVDVYLPDLWPSDTEIDDILARHVRPEQYASAYKTMFSVESATANATVPARFSWNESSTYIRRPPYWNSEQLKRPNFTDMRPLAILGDNITTDHMSPSGAILAESAAGKYLLEHGVLKEDFNSYGTRRGDHLVTIRATFANNRLRNEMAPGTEGSYARLEPEGQVMPLFDAAQAYLDRQQPLIIVAGKNYGAGSSRDWAAKGVKLLGVKAVVAESFERIHRSNLIGMGIVPLEFVPGTTRHTLHLTGSELYTLEGLTDDPTPRATLTLVIRHADGSGSRVPVLCRIDTVEEVEYFRAGGLLPVMYKEFLAAARNPN